MMDHAEAEREGSVERYLLGQLSEAQQDRFEEHYFVCAACADEVKAGAAFVANLRSVLSERPAEETAAERRWWHAFLPSASGWAPAAALAACGALAFIVGYQNLVQVPALRSQPAAGSVLSISAPVRVVAERAGEPVALVKTAPVAALAIAHDWEEPYTGYQVELRHQSGAVAARSALPATKDDLVVTLRPSELEAGRYSLTVYGVKEGGAEPAPVARTPIIVSQ